ncbi:MAG: radical SAM protein [Candidatus Stygibacter frigidus]|nr:radical SAM protein [Candidatus Stygibacter frigidus]
MPNEIEVKKILKKNRFPEAFAGKYSFSPYMGCGHDCKYCDGRFEKYHFEGELHKDIAVRTNTAELLAKELPKLREYGPICISSGISDAYQPFERKYGIMSDCADVLAEYDFPLIFHTKNNLISRDWAKWQKVNARGGVNLYVSLTWLDDKLAAKFEPHASSASQRMELLAASVAADFRTGILAMPLIPGISDSPAHIKALLQKARDLKVDFIWISSLTLKPGRQKDYFLDFIKAEFPESLENITQLYTNNDPYGSPIHNRQFYYSLLPLYKKYGFTDVIPHQVFHGNFAIYDEINILLHDLHKLYHQNRKGTIRLKKATALYKSWLKEKKDFLAHRRNLSYRDIDKEIIHLLKNDKFQEIIENPKLEAFFQQIFLHHKLFDYYNLRFSSDL